MVVGCGVCVNSVDYVGFFVGNNVVGVFKVLEMSCEVGCDVENMWRGRVDGEKFFYIENLEVMVGGFGFDI